MGSIRLTTNLFVIVAFLFSLPVQIEASPDLEKKYLNAYNIVREAFDDKGQGQQRIALQKFQTAKQILWEIKTEDPKWHAQTIKYLIRDCDTQIQELYQNSNIRGGSEYKAEARVDLLIDQLMTVKRNRQSTNTQQPVRRQVSQPPASTRLPSLASMIKKNKTATPKKTVMATQVPNPPVRQRAYSETRMMPEKLEALEAAFIQKKKEADQWQLQYNILEEKAREELQMLSNEFANQKTALEAELVALKKEMNKNEKEFRLLKNRAAQQQQTEKSLKQAQIKIEELERALHEAQQIRSKAEEEAKILEGQVVLNLKEEYQKDRNTLLNQFETQRQDFKEKIEALNQQVQSKQSEITKLEKQLAVEKSKKSAEQKQKIAELEQKLLVTVKEKAEIQTDAVSKIESLQKELKKEKEVNRSEVEALKEQIQKQRKIEQNLKEEIAYQKEQVQKFETKQSSASDLKGQIARMESRLKFKDKIIRELEEKLTENRKELAQQVNLVAGIKAQLSAKNEEFKKLEDQVLEEKKNAARWKLKSEKVSETLSSLETKIDKYEEEKEYFLAQEKKNYKLKEQFENEQNNFQKRLIALEQELNQARSDLARKEGSIRKVLIEADEKLAKVKTDNEQTIMDLLLSFKREKEKWKTEIDELKSKLSDKSGDAELLASAQKAESKLAEVIEENDQLKSENLKINSEIKILKEKLGKSIDSSEKERLYTELKGKESVNTQLQEKVDKYEARIDDLKNLLENSESEKKSLYEEINQLNEMVAQLRLDLKRTDDINAQLRDTVSQVKLSTAVRKPVVPAVESPQQETAPPQPKSDLLKNDALTEDKVKEILEKVKDLFREGKYKEALRLLNQQLELYPLNDRFMFYKGLTFSRLKQADDAIEAYKKTVEVNPKMAKAYNNLGNLYSQKKKYGKAIENLKKATDLDPNLSEAFNNMGIVYSHLGQFDESIKSFITATEINPNLVAAYYNLGQIYYHDKKWDAASTSFQKVLSLKPDHVEAKDYLAQIDKEQGDRGTRLALEPEID